MTELDEGALAAWSESRQRGFPWRKSKDPYRLAVTELMLVRTKAPQVEEVWEDFFERYPDAASLARASEEEVQGALASLGLRWRTRKIRQVAKELAQKYPEGVPSEVKNLERLDSLGPYSSRALRISMKGHGDLPVDWGVARILSRLKGIEVEGEIRRARPVLAAARALSPCSKEVFWSLIDLARDICLPRRPRCWDCPLQSGCRWAATHAKESARGGEL